MKTLIRTAAIIALLASTNYAFSQDNNDALKTLINEGIALNDSGKYEQAVDKYKQVLKIDPNNDKAYYEIAYTLFTSGKAKEAIPYLEKLLKINPGAGGGYDMLGSIYDDDKQPEKAIEYYLQGIKADPEYQRLYFNISITYYKLGKYSDAEKNAIEAIKLDPKHASSQRIYAMATYKLKKRTCSLLGWTSFLLLEPQSKRSPDAIANIKNIIGSGIKRTGEKSVNITMNADDTESLMLPISVLAATDSKQGLSMVDSLQLQLTSVFKVCHTMAGSKENPIVIKFFADYFSEMAKTDNMPALARVLTLSSNRDENLKWFKENPDKLKTLNDWIANTKREL